MNDALDAGPYRHRHPETFVVPETTDPAQAIAVAREQALAAEKRARVILEALTIHDAQGQLLTQEWELAVLELNLARAHHTETLARWADEALPPTETP